MSDELIYKFYSAHRGRDALYRKRLKVTTLSDINDPFEFLATSTKQALRQKARALREAEFGDAGVISFSQTWQEPLLWSHYAKNHSGIALGFKLLKPNTGFPVDYGNQRVQFPDPNDLRPGQLITFWNQIRLRKHNAWCYEKEIRVFPSLQGSVFENGLYFRLFSDLVSLHSVVLGPEYVPIGDSALQSKLEGSGVSIVTSRLSFKKFEVVEQRSKKKRKTL